MANTRLTHSCQHFSADTELGVEARSEAAHMLSGLDHSSGRAGALDGAAPGLVFLEVGTVAVPALAGPPVAVRCLGQGHPTYLGLFCLWQGLADMVAAPSCSLSCG